MNSSIRSHVDPSRHARSRLSIIAPSPASLGQHPDSYIVPYIATELSNRKEISAGSMLRRVNEYNVDKVQYILNEGIHVNSNKSSPRIMYDRYVSISSVTRLEIKTRQMSSSYRACDQGEAGKGCKSKKFQDEATSFASM